MCIEDRPWSDRPVLAAGLSCVWSLMKDPLLHEKRFAVVEGEIDREGERERVRERKKAPPWLCRRSLQKREMGVG